MTPRGSDPDMDQDAEARRRAIAALVHAAIDRRDDPQTWSRR